MSLLRRRRLRALGSRLLIALVASSICSAATVALYRRGADGTVGGMQTTPFKEQSLNREDDDPVDPANFLIVGSDSRSDAVESERETVTGQRSDTIMVAHVDPLAKTATLVSFPRDLVVDIPGRGRQKINSAFNGDLGGGPELLVLTLQQNFGIDINHYVEVDFSGFQRIVDRIGRVNIYFPAPAKDDYTQLSIRYYGCAALDGADALRYVRSRHYEYYDFEREEWVEDPTSDFGRIRRQQYFIRSLMQQSLERSLGRPDQAFSIIDSLANTLTVDDSINVDDLKKLVHVFLESNPAAVEMLTVPVQSDNNGGLLLRDEEAQPMFDRLALEPVILPSIDYSKFRIDVVNAGSTEGAAQTAMGELARLGFTRGVVGDAPSSSQTELRYSTPNGRAAAEFVKLFMNGVGVVIEDPTLESDSDLVVALGPDFDGIDDGAPDSTTTSGSVVGTTATTIAPNPGRPPEGEIVETGSQFVGCD